MDDLRGSFSRLKKGVKHRLAGSKRKADEPGAGGRGEIVDVSGSLPRPEAGVVTGGGPEQEGKGSNLDNENVEPSAAADENVSDWKSIVSSTAKLLLRGVRDSADAFGPLKAVAGGLCFILENCEVRSPLPSALSTQLTGTLANDGKQTGDRIAGTPGQSTRRIALQTCF